LAGAIGATGPQGPAGPITSGSVVMLTLLGNGNPPPAPAGYTLAGYTFLSSKPNGGPTITYAVYTKN
jgi:hypothetical protein